MVVGRIVDDRIIEPSETADPKFTEANLVLEPSRGDGGGRRIPLRFAPNLRFHPDALGRHSPRPGIGLYPGAIAAFKGSKAHGQEGPFFMVREILLVRVALLAMDSLSYLGIYSSLHCHRRVKQLRAAQISPTRFSLQVDLTPTTRISTMSHFSPSSGL